MISTISPIENQFKKFSISVNLCLLAGLLHTHPPPSPLMTDVTFKMTVIVVKRFLNKILEWH